MLSYPLNLRSIKPCGLRKIEHKQISPCELRLTEFSGESSIRCLSLTTEADFAFCLNGWNWTNCIPRKRRILFHWATLQPTKMCCLSCFTRFCRAKYNTPSTFCLADYSVIFHDKCIATAVTPVKATQKPIRLLTSSWVRPLEQMNYPFSYQLTGWFCSEVGTTRYFPSTQVPSCEACKPTFFPLHQLPCYLHRSYQWRLPYGSEQACLDWQLKQSFNCGAM